VRQSHFYENIQYPLIRHYISSPTAYIQCVDFSHSDRQAIKANSLSQCRPPGSIGNDSPGTAVAKNEKSNVIRGQNCNLVTWSSPYVFVSLSVVTENLIYWARKPNRVQTETQCLFCWVITTETYKKNSIFLHAGPQKIAWSSLESLFRRHYTQNAGLLGEPS